MKTWKRIGINNNHNLSKTYKKFDPSPQKNVSTAKNINSLTKSSSYEKIRLSYQSRDTNKCIVDQNSSYLDKMTTLILKSQSSTSLVFKTPVKKQPTKELETMKIFIKIILNYVRQMKEQFIDLKENINKKNTEFQFLITRLHEENVKLINKLTFQVNNQKNYLKDVLDKVTDLQQINLNLKQKISSLQVQKLNLSQDLVEKERNLRDCFINQKNSNSTITSLNQQKIQIKKEVNSKVSSLFELQGIRQIQKTINKMKHLLMESNQK